MMDDPIYGKTRESIGVYEIEVTKHPRVLEVGKIIKKLMFNDYPDFLLNIIATSAYVDPNTYQSDYPNPTSHWYNVFYGFYEIAIPKNKVESAYGFDKNGEVIAKDIIKIGLCDWNLVTAYMYGVPLEACQPNVKITGNEEYRVLERNVKIGNFTYTLVECRNIIATSVYPGLSKLDTPNFIASKLQKSWGTHPYVQGYDDAYPPVRMAARFYITWSVGHNNDYDGPCWKTFVGGGVIHLDYPDEDFNNKFLDLQMEKVRESILMNEKND
jgi:hypothetical protein